MFQLKFSDDYKCIIEDIPYWKTPEDIPENIVKSLLCISDNLVVYDESTKNYCCGKCLQPLDEHFYCNRCNIQHNDCTNDLSKWKMDETVDERDFKLVNSIKYDYTYYKKHYYNGNYYVFDVVDNRVLLYLLNEDISYSTPTPKEVHKYSSFSVSEVYLIEKDGITDLHNNKYYPFHEVKYAIEEFFFEEENFDRYQPVFDLFCSDTHAYLYLDNLKQLQKTIYKYSFLWEYGSYLNQKGEYITLESLIYFPICYSRQFEYLLKFKLYKLAFHSANTFQNGNSFQSIFGVNKQHLPFMVQNNISGSQLSIFKLYQVEDIEEIKKLEEYLYIIQEIQTKFHVSIEMLIQYFKKHNLEYSYFFEYQDYLEMAEKQGFNVKDNHIKFPNNLMEEHNRLYLQMKMIEDPTIDSKIRNLSKVLDFNHYEDEKYIIFPADSIDSLINESEQQNNCVRTYCNKVAHNISQIYFMREKNNSSKSLVTIEVRKGKIVQARTKFNELPSEEIKKVLKKWEKTLLPIINGKEDLDDID